MKRGIPKKFSDHLIAKDKRISWDEFWFLIAMIYSVRGTCDRLHTACILVKEKRIVGAGYNGSVAGLEHCDQVGHLVVDGHCERTLHAEENAIINTDRHNVRNASAYILGTPCVRCLKLLVNAGVSSVFYVGEYINARGRTYLNDIAKHIVLKQFHFDPKKLWSEAEEFLKGSGGVFRVADFPRDKPH